MTFVAFTSGVVGSILLLFIMYSLILPFFIYSLYIYKTKKRHKVYFTKRKQLLIEIVIAFSISGIFIENHILIYFHIFHYQSSLLSIILHYLNIATLIGLFFILLIRLYAIYFQSQYNEAIISQKWKEHVNEEHEDFFIANRHKYGNDKYLSKFCICTKFEQTNICTFVHNTQLHTE